MGDDEHAASPSEQQRDTQPRPPARSKDHRIGRYDWEKARGPIHAFGESKNLVAWAGDPRCQVRAETLRTRLAVGWKPEDAIARPKHEQAVLEYTHSGRTLTLRGWADQSGIKYHTLYSRIRSYGMTFEEALDKGADGPHFAIAVTAFGKTQPLYRWGVDPRAAVTATTIRKRILAGWNPQQAITEPPDIRSTLDSGIPYDAFGKRMSLPAWARLSGIPSEVINQRINGHSLTLEAALHSLGWTPPQHTPAATDRTTVPLGQLQIGDLLVSIDTERQIATVDRPSAAGPTALPVLRSPSAATRPTAPAIKTAAPRAHRR
ncbi:hypothetical protein [Streptomyces sp. NPDC048340]|uniref:hypothetical protein n=1 Tax=Streptomyces sp. NPDC048340 TaxID=3365537 RepID=UPI00371692B3